MLTVACASCCLCVAQDERQAFDVQTLDAITYIRDYKPGHLDDTAFYDAIAANTPDLLVLGKDAPLHHNWGFVAGTGGENQAFGKGDAIRRLSPPEAFKKKEKIRAMVAKLRGLGVRWVMPYICTMTIGGHHEKRTGFWEFYDHWDEYAGPFNLGPRPQDDPADWMQRTPEGKWRTYYQWDAPYYAPNYRWAACINHPAWRQHLSNVVRLAAEAGYDGVYMDNNRSTRCYCPHCQAAFDPYAARRGLPKARLSAEPGTYAWRVTAEFWSDSKVAVLRHLKAVGTRALGREFHIFANPSSWLTGCHEIARLSSVASFIQSEENGHGAGAHPGLARTKIAGPLYYQTHNRRVVEYKFTQSLCSGLRTTMTTRTLRAGPGPSRRAVDQNAQTAWLSIAEAAAYAGGGAFNMNLRWDTGGATRAWRAFLHEHQPLYQGCDAWAPVGVVALPEQHYFDNSRRSEAMLHRAALGLAENQVLFDFVHEAHLRTPRLRRYRVVIVPAGVRCLSDGQVAALAGFASAGGRLIILGDDFAMADERCRPRPERERTIAQAQRLPETVPPDALIASLGEHGGIMADPAGRVPFAVGVNGYAKPSWAGPSEIILHVVNYSVPLGRSSAAPPEPVPDLTARVPLPHGWRADSARAFSPVDKEDLRVTLRQEGSVAVLRLPKLYLYQAIRIQGRREAK